MGVILYRNKNNNSPFIRWYSKLDKVTKLRIKTVLIALAESRFNDIKALDNHLFEARIHLRPGYRIYFSKLSSDSVVVLIGGTKGTQPKDISKAKRYLDEFLRRY